MGTDSTEGSGGVTAIYGDSEGYLAADIWIVRPRFHPVNMTIWFSDGTPEARTIDGHPAIVKSSHTGAWARIFNETTGILYTAFLYPNEDDPDGRGIDDAIAIARSLYRDQPAPAAGERLRLSYNRFDATDWARTPGSYVFSRGGSALTTYEELREPTPALMYLHQSDAHRRSQAEVFAGDAVGDLFEWRQADDCWVRYQVTRPPWDRRFGPLRKGLAIEPMTYAFTGCSGPVVLDAPVTFDFGPLPDLGGPSLTVPVRHGAYQLVPEGWTGAVEEPEVYPLPGDSYTNPAYTTDLAEARQLPYWRDPALPAGWTFKWAISGDVSGPAYGYWADFTTERGRTAFTIWGYYAGSRGHPEETSWLNGRGISETRVIAGRPARVIYSPPGPSHDDLFPVTVWIYDPATEAEYMVLGGTKSLLGGNVDAVIAIAESLFAPPNEPEPSPPRDTRRVTPASPIRDAPPDRSSASGSGDGYNCALTDSAEAVCWVSDGFWGLLPPDPPPGRYTSIRVGSWSDGLGSHYTTVCAIADTGDIVCWQGAHTSGEPQSIVHYPGDYAVVRILGSSFCALTSDGKLVSAGWGWDVSPGCVQITADDSARYVAIDTDRNHFCAITAAGRAECVTHGLGWLWSGALTVMHPPDPPPGRHYTAISLDGGSACALTDSGEEVCWEAVENKVEPPDPPPGPYVAVSDGLGHTCVLAEDGEAVCWGRNNYGQAEAPSGRYIAISAGYAATCALTDEGEPVCWGWGYLDGRGFPPGPYTAISAGYAELCALTEHGEAVCWDFYPVNEPVKTPPGPFTSISQGWFGHACGLTVAGEGSCWDLYSGEQTDVPPGRYEVISAGHGTHTCAITESGEAVCWGGRYGRPQDPPAGRFASISAGVSPTCALTDAGEAACSGSFLAFKYDPDYGPVDPPAGRYTAISSSHHRTCALTDAGQVVCWGDMDYEQSPEFAPH